MNELEVLSTVDFDWTTHLKSVWKDPPCDVPELHQDLRQDFSTKIKGMVNKPKENSPLGWVVTGSGGSGKTHLMSAFRQESVTQNAGFILVDMTDVNDFWETVLLGYWNSLQQEYKDGNYQYRYLLEQFVKRLRPNLPVQEAIKWLTNSKTTDLSRGMNLVLQALNKTHPQQTKDYCDVIRALIANNSDDFSIANLGATWLQGTKIEEEDRKLLGFNLAQQRPIKIVKALSWLMSLCGPTVLALDQLDPIVTQLHYDYKAASEKEIEEEKAATSSIIENIASGLSALRDVTTNTLTILSCVETTWHTLRNLALSQDTDRFEEPTRALTSIGANTVAMSLVQQRMKEACDSLDCVLPYPTWPFQPEAFSQLQAISPRELLKQCHLHRNQCLKRKQVSELSTFDLKKPKASQTNDSADLSTIDQLFQQHFKAANLQELLKEQQEDINLGGLIQTACKCYLKEQNMPDTIDPVVDTEFTGGKSTVPLHARIRLIFPNEESREEHYCFRALEKSNANAFQSRIKAAMTQSGIDKKLNFRHLTLLRTTDIPGGATTKDLTTKFKNAGGIFVNPDEDELRSMWALKELENAKLPDFEDWLRSKKPASQFSLIQSVFKNKFTSDGATEKHDSNGQQLTNSGEDHLNEDGSVLEDPAPTVVTDPPPKPTSQETTLTNDPKTVPTDPPNTGTQPVTAIHDGPSIQPDTSIPTDMEAELFLGQRLIGEKVQDSVTMPVNLLEKHTIVLAGAGSGKTVLLKRLVEEVALLGIPSIVIDCANDLATIADRLEQPHPAWMENDAEKANRYHAQTEVIVWTPGKNSGNPINLEPLPDLTAVADDPEELEEAVASVREALGEIVAAGNSASAKNKKGLLSSALKYFAQHNGGNLKDFIELLSHLPPEAGLQLNKEDKLATEIADLLRVEIEMNPLLKSQGSTLDPAVLFGDDNQQSGKTRISVINFIGLPGLEAQRHFLNQLAMILFSWIKKYPKPPGRSLRGLLVIDEAKDFVPSQKNSICKESLRRLAAQARKYHLGVVFATQNPKEIENTIIGNCSTHFYGKANSPAAIEVVKDLIKQKQGTGDDVSVLKAGRFYAYNADAKMNSPMKLAVPMCLSHHRSDPLEESEVIERALISRKRLNGST